MNIMKTVILVLHAKCCNALANGARSPFFFLSLSLSVPTCFHDGRLMLLVMLALAVQRSLANDVPCFLWTESLKSHDLHVQPFLVPMRLQVSRLML